MRRVHAGNTLECSRHFFQLERVVVNKSKSIQTDIELLRYDLDVLALRHPVDLGIQEIVGDTQLFQTSPCARLIVLAGDTQQNAPFIKVTQQFKHMRPQSHLLTLKQYAVPHGIVEIPHYAFYLWLSG